MSPSSSLRPSLLSLSLSLILFLPLPLCHSSVGPFISHSSFSLLFSLLSLSSPSRSSLSFSSSLPALSATISPRRLYPVSLSLCLPSQSSISLFRLSSIPAFTHLQSLSPCFLYLPLSELPVFIQLPSLYLLSHSSISLPLVQSYPSFYLLTIYLSLLSLTLSVSSPSLSSFSLCVFFPLCVFSLIHPSDFLWWQFYPSL